MKLASLALALALCSLPAHASEKESDMMCTKEARSHLVSQFKIPADSLSFYGGATLGDGVDTLEIDTYRVANAPGFYKVELDVDGCDLRNIERVDN